ncbi:MAG: branched-chain amino acid ABC transporter permease [candidate division NC10 bacterium]|nr:branched-chain amino acid ABC transporter permease [candidate division NC10 bacterium]
MKRREGSILNIILILLLLVGLALLPQVASRFSIYLTIQILLLSLLAMGFNLLFGYTGLLSFGHAAFYAIGAYAAGLILKEATPSLLLAVLVGTAVAALFSLVIGFFCVRHTKIYFSMLTLAFGMMVYSLIWKWRDVTGGDDGLIGIPRGTLSIPGLLQVNLHSMESYYYFVLIVCLLSTLFLHRLVHSSFGLILQGIRENAERVAFTGISVQHYRLLAFIISGAFAGLAGTLLPPLENTLAPAVAHWTKSAEPVLVSLLGGAQTFAGPIIGSILFLVIKESIVRHTEYWLIWFGAILLVLVLGFRGGIVGFLYENVLTRLRR